MITSVLIFQYSKCLLWTVKEVIKNTSYLDERIINFFHIPFHACQDSSIYNIYKVACNKTNNDYSKGNVS